MSSEYSYSDVDVGNVTEIVTDPYIISPLKEILIISFTVTFLLGLFGNLLVIFVIARNRSMHTVTNFFLANLAIADLLVSIFCVIPKLLYYVSTGWYYTDFLCKIHNYVMSATTTSSIFILTVISMERFIAILRPLETRRLLTAGRLTVAMAAVWIASATFNIHTAWYYEVTYIADTPYCIVTGRVLKGKMSSARIQSLVFFVIYYVIPLTVMAVLYGFICHKLWASSKLRLVASDSEKKEETGKRRRGLVSRLAGVRYLIIPQGRTRQSSDRPGKEPQCVSSTTSGQQRTALGNSEEIQVLMETHVSAGSGDQKIGPFFLDEPDEDSAPSGCGDQLSIYKPRAQGNQQPIRIQVDLAESKEYVSGRDTNQSIHTANGPGRINGNSLAKNNNISKVRSGRPGVNQNRVPTPRPLTISKPERSKNRKNKKKETIAARKKVIRLLIVIVSSFAICLLPYQVISLWANFGRRHFPHNSIAMLVFLPFTYLCYFFNSALNPFLYAFLSDNFRKRMRETLTLRSSTRRKSWMRTQARLRSMTEGNTETETMYTMTCT